jgi:hypothetical protein
MALPCFIHLAIQLCKSLPNASLLRELFVRCSEDALKEDCCLPMKKAVTSLQKLRIFVLLSVRKVWFAWHHITVIVNGRKSGEPPPFLYYKNKQGGSTIMFVAN